MIVLYSVGTLSMSIAAYVLLGGNTERLDFISTVDFLLFIVSIRMTAGCLVIFLIGIIKRISFTSIIIIYASIAVLLLFISKGTDFRLPTFSLFHPEVVTAIIIIVGATLVFLLARAQAKPLMETDSILAFPYMRDWISRKTSTIEHAYGYSSLWECNLLPGFLFLKRGEACRGHVVLSQIEPVIGMALILIDLCLRMQLHGSLIALITIHFLSMNIIWSWPTGVGTFKNDNAYAFGVACFSQTLWAVHAEGATWLLLVQLACAALLASLKYSGFLLLPVISWLSVIFVFFLDKSAHVTDIISIIFLAGVLCVSVAGVFPLRNYLKHGNPLYPVQIKFRGKVLTGTISPKQTSIFHALREPRLPGSLFGRHDFGGRMAWPIGLLPFLGLIAAPAVILLMITQKLTPIFAKDQYQTIVISAWAASISLVAGYIWIKTVWSASRENNDLAYLMQLWSVRYIIFVPLLISVTISGFITTFFGQHTNLASILIASIFAVDTKLRLDASRWSLYADRDRDIRDLVAVALFTAGALFLLPALTNTFALIAAFLTLTIALQSYFDKVFGENYRNTSQNQNFYVARELIDKLAVAKIFVVDNVLYANEPNWIGSCAALVMGDRMQHEISVGSDLELSKHIGSGEKVDFVVSGYTWTSQEKLASIRSRLNLLVEASGFQLVRSTPTLSLFASNDGVGTACRDPADSPDASKIDSIPALLSIGRGRSMVIPRAGRTCSAGQQRDLLLQLPSISLALSAAEMLDLVPLVRVAESLQIAEQHEIPWAIRSNDHIKVTVLDEDGSRFIRIVPASKCQWLAVIFFVGALGRARPISLFTQVRSVGETSIVLGSWDQHSSAGPDGRFSEKNFGVLKDWTLIAYPQIFEGCSGGERLSVNVQNCVEGEGMDINVCEILDLVIEMAQPEGS